MSSGGAATKQIGVREIAAKKSANEKIVVVTAYDALFGRLVDEAGVDVVLVGDSLANVVLGLDSTLAVTLDQMIHHARAVRRGVSRAMLVVDMPFLSYQVDDAEAMRNAGRVMQETGAAAVKLEGGGPRIVSSVQRLVEIGIPVMGHLGFTPQSVHALGGARVQGRTDQQAETMLSQAKALQDAGAFSVVLELVPSAVAEHISKELTIPTIGIGAGVGCDGQVLVLPDMLGLNDRFTPRFLKRYATLADSVRDAVRTFGEEVREGAYPDDAHSF